MSRVKRGTVVKKRHKKILKQAKGFWGQRKNVFKRANETLLRAWAYAFKSRKLFKRNMRSLFISRITAATRAHGLAYNAFIDGLNKTNIVLNRKMLSQLAICEPEAFSRIVNIAKR